MIIVTEKKPFKRSYYCECEYESCEQCMGGNFPTVSVNGLYDLIKNPPAAPIGVVTHVYNYEADRS